MYRFMVDLCFFSGRRRHTRSLRDWSSDVCSSDLKPLARRTYIGACADESGALTLGLQKGGYCDPTTSTDAGGPRASQRSEERRVGKEWRWEVTLSLL